MFDSIDLNRVNSGMFSDSLDKLGYCRQVIPGYMSNISRPKFIGRCRTVKLEEVETDDENISTGLGFLESVASGEILIVQGSTRFAYFGELMTRLSIRNGIAGVVIEGLTRDSDFTHTISSLPILSRGYTPVDIKGRGRVDDIDVPIMIGDVSIEPGNWVFADNDAVIVIPKTAEATLFKMIMECIENEIDIISKINEGKSVSQILSKHKEF